VRPKVHAAFVVAGAVFVVLLCTAGVRATPSILIVPLEREFGWSRALLSSVVSLNLVLYGLVGPVERGQPEGCARGPGFTGLGRNGSRGRSRSGDRTAEPHRL
jgi:hypothetical protein